MSSSDSEYFHVSRTLLSILADLGNGVMWIVSACPLMFKSSKLSTNRLGIVPSAPITIGITDTIMFHSFLVPEQGLDIYLSFRFLFILLCALLTQPNPPFGQFSRFCFFVLFCFFTIITFGRLAQMK